MLRRRPSLVTVVTLLFLLSISARFVVTNAGMPMEYTVQAFEKECWYDSLEEEEYLTVEVSVLKGDRLEATVFMEGPVAPKDATRSSDIANDVKAFERGIPSQEVERRLARGPPDDGAYFDVGPDGYLRVQQPVNFEVAYQHFDDFNDDDIAGMVEETDDLVEREHIQEMVEEERDLARKRYEKSMEEMRRKQVVSNMGEPYIRTVQIFAAGWYRVCFQPRYSKVKADVEMRKSSECGTPPSNDLHVPRKSDAPKYFEEENSDEDAADSEDLNKAKEHLATLERAITEMKRRQEQAHNQATMQRTVGDHSNARMYRSSLLETVLFFAVSGFQVYTVRKWFASGAPLLGR